MSLVWGCGARATRADGADVSRALAIKVEVDNSLNAASENGASLRRLATKMQELLQRLQRTFPAHAEQGEPPDAPEPFEPEAFDEEVPAMVRLAHKPASLAGGGRCGRARGAPDLVHMVIVVVVPRMVLADIVAPAGSLVVVDAVEPYS